MLMIIKPSVLLCSFLLRIPFSAFTTSMLSWEAKVRTGKLLRVDLIVTERQWFVSKSPRPAENIILVVIVICSMYHMHTTQLLYRGSLFWFYHID